MDHRKRVLRETRDVEDKGIRVILLARRPRLAIAMTKVLEKSSLIETVTRVDSPDRVVDVTRQARGEVVVMEADRPGCDLVELCRAISQQTSARVVLLSTESRQGPVRDALAAGAHSLLAWPFKPRDFVMAVVHAAYSADAGALESMAMVESEMSSASELNTTALAPLLDWASRASTDQVSPRLKQNLRRA
jgi:DNA-binding NarL/FixJ family response regulator